MEGLTRSFSVRPPFLILVVCRYGTISARQWLPVNTRVYVQGAIRALGVYLSGAFSKPLLWREAMGQFGGNGLWSLLQRTWPLLLACLISLPSPAGEYKPLITPFTRASICNDWHMYISGLSYTIQTPLLLTSMMWAIGIMYTFASWDAVDSGHVLVRLDKHACVCALYICAICM